VVVVCLIIPSIPTHEHRCKHMVLMSPPACPTAWSHPPLIPPCVSKDQRLAPRSMTLWEALPAKNRCPQPSSSYIRSFRTTFQCTERIHSQIVLSARDDVMNFSMCTRTSSTSTGELLYSIVMMLKLYSTSLCPLFAAYSMCWSPSALEPNS
jgi:hypothetical protein